MPKGKRHPQKDGSWEMRFWGCGSVGGVGSVGSVGSVGGVGGVGSVGEVIIWR